MISDFDDYPVHQTPEPVAQPATTDRNFYDRYWFNGFDREGKLYFGAALGLYPNRQVMDAAFSVVIDGVQHCVLASRRAPSERADLAVGPVRLAVVEPMRAIRLRVGPNAEGLTCDLTFRARTAPYEEPRSTLRADGRVILDTTRFLQFGTWEGEIDAGGTRLALDRANLLGVRDRSWGIRPVGEHERGATPRSEPGIYWLWSVNHFDEFCTFYETFEGHDGSTILAHGAILPAYDSPEAIPRGPAPGVVPVPSAEVSIDWRKGTRWAERARLTLAPSGRAPLRHELEPLLRFHFKGIGYQHPEWGHGVWKGEEAVQGETFRTSDLDPLAFPNLHVQQVCRASLDGRVGLGALEQLVIGSYAPAGLRGMNDGVP